MLTAKEAKTNTDKVRALQIHKAGDMLINEWETYLEPRIAAAVKQGKYYTTYHWTRGVFDEYGVIVQDFLDELQALADMLGYVVKATICGNSTNIIDVKISIDWREEK